MTNNKLFERIRLQATLRNILNTWGEQQGYEIIHSALEKEIHYEQLKKAHRASIAVGPHRVRLDSQQD